MNTILINSVLIIVMHSLCLVVPLFKNRNQDAKEHLEVSLGFLVPALFLNWLMEFSLGLVLCYLILPIFIGIFFLKTMERELITKG